MRICVPDADQGFTILGHQQFSAPVKGEEGIAPQAPDRIPQGGSARDVPRLELDGPVVVAAREGGTGNPIGIAVEDGA